MFGRRKIDLAPQAIKNLQSEPDSADNLPAFRSGIGDYLQDLEDRWHIKVGKKPLEGGSWSLVLPCVSPHGKQLVLKLSPNHRRIAAERAALEAWSGNPLLVNLCQAQEGALLEERVLPGTTTPSLSLGQQAELLNALTQHAENRPSAAYDWKEWKIERVVRRTQSLAGRAGLPEASEHIETLAHQALQAGADLAQGMLHGDIYSENLLGSHGGSKLIDPYGVWGPREIDTACCALNFTPLRGSHQEQLRRLTDLRGQELWRVKSFARLYALSGAVHHRAMQTPAARYTGPLVELAFAQTE